jgi:hypothetical protein
VKVPSVFSSVFCSIDEATADLKGFGDAGSIPVGISHEVADCLEADTVPIDKVRVDRGALIILLVAILTALIEASELKASDAAPMDENSIAWLLCCSAIDLSVCCSVRCSLCCSAVDLSN